MIACAAERIGSDKPNPNFAVATSPQGQEQPERQKTIGLYSLAVPAPAALANFAACGRGQ